MSEITVRRIRDRWLELDLDPAIAAIAVEATERVEALAAEARLVESDARAERDAIVTALASGETTLAEAVERDLALSHRGAAKAAADDLLKAAKGRAAGLAVKRLRRLGDQLIVEHLAPAHDDCIATIVKMAGKLEGVASDADAARAPKAQREAWATILAAVIRRNRLVKLTEELRDDGIIPAAKRAHPDDYLYRHPDRLPRHLPRRGTPAVPAHLRILEAVQAGAEPALLTAAEVDERHGPPRPKRPARVKVERDGTTIVDGIRPAFVGNLEPSTIAPHPHDPQPWSA